MRVLRITFYALASAVIASALATALNVATGGSLPEPLRWLEPYSVLAVISLTVVGGLLAALAQVFPVASTEASSSDQLNFPPPPPDNPNFINRVAELKKLQYEIKRSGQRRHGLIINLYGPPGIGKTALALHLAQSGKGVPPKKLFVPLDKRLGRDPSPAVVLENVLARVDPSRAYNGSNEAVLSDRFATLTSRLRYLLVLDNVSDDATILPLLPRRRGQVLLVTSRGPLNLVPGSVQMGIDKLDSHASSQVINRILGDLAAPIDDLTMNNLAERCGHWPLALVLVAAQLRSSAPWAVIDSLQRISTGQDQVLDAIPEIEASFQTAYDALAPVDALAFRRLAVLPSRFVSAGFIATLCRLPRTEAARTLERLHSAQLVQPYADGTYSVHDLVKDFAGRLTHRLDTTSDQRAAQMLALRHYRELVVGASVSLTGHAGFRSDQSRLHVQLEALKWFKNAQFDLMTVARTYLELREATELFQVTASLRSYFFLTGNSLQWVELETSVLEYAEECAALDVQGGCLMAMGEAYRRQGRTRMAIDTLLRAGQVLEGLDHADLPRCWIRLAGAYREDNQESIALEYYDKAADRLVHIGDLVAEASMLIDKGICLKDVGRTRDAFESLNSAITLLNGLADPGIEELRLTAWANENIAVLYRIEGNLFEAHTHHMVALNRFNVLHEEYGAGYSLRNLAELALYARDTSRAEHLSVQSLERFRSVADEVGIGQAHGSLAVVLLERRRYIKSAKHMVKMFKSYETAGVSNYRRPVIRKLLAMHKAYRQQQTT